MHAHEAARVDALDDRHGVDREVYNRDFVEPPAPEPGEILANSLVHRAKEVRGRRMFERPAAQVRAECAMELRRVVEDVVAQQLQSSVGGVVYDRVVRVRPNAIAVLYDWTRPAFVDVARGDITVSRRFAAESHPVEERVETFVQPFKSS